MNSKLIVSAQIAVTALATLLSAAVLLTAISSPAIAKYQHDYDSPTIQITADTSRFPAVESVPTIQMQQAEPQSTAAIDVPNSSEAEKETERESPLSETANTLGEPEAAQRL